MAATVRDAKPEDEEAILVVHNSSWRRSYSNLFPEDYLKGDDLLEKQRAHWNTYFDSSRVDYKVRVAEENNKVIGVVAWQRDGARTVELTELFVAPYFWSTGVGSALLRDARDQWKADGYEQAYLWTPVDNARAHRSYKKNAWEITEEAWTQEIDGHKIEMHKLELEL